MHFESFKGMTNHYGWMEVYPRLKNGRHIASSATHVMRTVKFFKIYLYIIMIEKSDIRKNSHLKLFFEQISSNSGKVSQTLQPKSNEVLLFVTENLVTNRNVI